MTEKDPVKRACGDHIPGIDWGKVDYIKPDPVTGVTILPAEWDDPEDDGLYDDLVPAELREELGIGEPSRAEEPEDGE
ncbi:MAG: hypothetical protein ACI36Y_01890 [Coriobacteriales bacterium]